jgi:hypothetical protein
VEIITIFFHEVSCLFGDSTCCGWNTGKTKSLFELVSKEVHISHYHAVTGVCTGREKELEKEVDLEGDGDGYSGTFRWKRSKILPSMPSSPAGANLNLSSGWMEYFLSRESTSELAQQLIAHVHQDLSLIDCLSTPLTISYLLQHQLSSQHIRADGVVHIVCIGTSSKTEGRILKETNCFHEISQNFPNIPHIQLYLVGPEMDTTSSSPSQLTANLSVTTFQGTSIQFFRSNSNLLNQETIVIGFNCGFGNWENPLPRRYDLCFQWFPDLYFLTGTRLPLYFTCANDYADLIGEVSLHQLIFGSYFILPPAENRFAYASTLVPPNSTKSTDYSRGNSYLYGVQGSDKRRRKVINPGDVNGLQLALKPSKLVACEDLAPPPKPVPVQEPKKEEIDAPDIKESQQTTLFTSPSQSNPPPPQSGSKPSQDSPPPPTVDTTTEIFTIHRSIRSQTPHSVLEIDLHLQPHISMKDIEMELSDSHEFFRITYLKGQVNAQVHDLPFNNSIVASSLMSRYHRSKHRLTVSVEIT